MTDLVRKIMPITISDIEQVRAIYGKSEDIILEDVNIIKKWIQQQSHLPEDYDNSRIERFLLRNKFRIEHTKAKLENYYTLRGLHSGFISNEDPHSAPMQNSRKFMIYVLLPKLTPGLERIGLCCLTGNEHLYRLEDSFLYILAILDIELSYDYAVGMRLIFDLKDYNMEHLKQFNIAKVGMVVKLHQEAFSGRLAGIEIINAPTFFGAMLGVLKLVNQRVASKIRVHDDLESLYKYIPKEYLPVEYGGQTFSMQDIHDDTGSMLLEKRQFLIEQSKKVSDENLRIGEISENQQFGANGTFKKINLD